MSANNTPILRSLYKADPDKYLFEAANNKNKIITGKNGITGIGRLEGPFQESEVVNQNNRIYPKTILESAINRDLMPQIESRELTGELDHSDDLTMLKNTSHAITEIHFEGNLVLGESVILPTPAGEIAAALYRSKVRVGISARGMGSTSPDYAHMTESSEPYEVVESDYFMITYDLVSKPSHKNALPELVERHQMVKLMKLMQEDKYLTAKREKDMGDKQFNEIADVIMDTLDISKQVRESDEFREWFGSILGISDIVANLKIEQIFGMSLQEMTELKNKM